MLDRTRSQQRKFKRLTAGRLGEILGNGDTGARQRQRPRTGRRPSAGAAERPPGGPSRLLTRRSGCGRSRQVSPVARTRTASGQLPD